MLSSEARARSPFQSKSDRTIIKRSLIVSGSLTTISPFNITNVDDPVCVSWAVVQITALPGAEGFPVTV
jgi:hypothetical protein